MIVCRRMMHIPVAKLLEESLCKGIPHLLHEPRLEGDGMAFGRPTHTEINDLRMYVFTSSTYIHL